MKGPVSMSWSLCLLLLSPSSLACLASYTQNKLCNSENDSESTADKNYNNITSIAKSHNKIQLNLFFSSSLLFLRLLKGLFFCLKFHIL